MSQFAQAGALMKALGHPVRLQIIEALRQDEACVCHLEHVLGLRQAYISQQLMKLRDAGLVIDRREGMNVYYSLAHPAIGALVDAGWQTLAALKGVPTGSFSLDTNTRSGCPCPKCQAKTTPIIKAADIQSA